MKTRYLAAFFLALALALLTFSIALANPPADNGNVTILTNADCENGNFYDIVIVAGQGVAGHVPDSTQVGLAKSLYIFVGVWLPIWERGAQGNPNLVWCEWDSPEGHFGGHVLFTPEGR